MLKNARSSSESLSFNENLVTLDANNRLSDRGVEPVDDLLPCFVIVEGILLLGEIEVSELDGPECE